MRKRYIWYAAGGAILAASVLWHQRVDGVDLVLATMQVFAAIALVWAVAESWSEDEKAARTGESSDDRP